MSVSALNNLAQSAYRVRRGLVLLRLVYELFLQTAHGKMGGVIREEGEGGEKGQTKTKPPP